MVSSKMTLLRCLLNNSFFLGFLWLAAPAYSNPPDRPATVVAVSVAQLQSWPTTLDTIATLLANQGVSLKSEISGRVSAVYFHSGMVVQAGAPLLQLNPVLLEAKLASATAQRQLSLADYRRARQLYQKKVLAKADLDKAMAIYQSRLADQRYAEAMLKQTLVRAPFSGHLGLRYVDLGDYIDPSKTLTSLNAIDPLRVDFRVPETLAPKLSVGSLAWVYTGAYPKERFQAIVYAIDSQIDFNTRSLGVRAWLANPQHKLLPGGFVEIALALEQPQNLLTVPETAVAIDGNGPYVYRAIHGRAVKTAVKIARRDANRVAIASGLVAGESVVSTGGFKLSDSMPIHISP